MKNLNVLILLLFCITANAQRQGTITYSMSPESSALASMMGDMQITLYYKNGKSLSEMSSPYYSMKTLVTDSGTLTLMTAMGQKMFFKSPVLSPGGPSDKKPMVLYTDQTKQILGYNCTKALVITNGGGAADTSVFWYTEKLPVVAFGKEAFLYEGLKGMPLEYEINTPQIKMTLVAQSVSTGEVPDSAFVLSTNGYTEFDAEKMLKQFQQQ